MPKIVEGQQRAFMTGNEVAAWAAIAAGADIMFGYPITPQNEIMHYWSRLAPKFGKKFLQTEDELSAGFTVLGGVMAGRKAFTATAGPGNVLMQESISMAEMMRIPAVWIIQQRGGPSTATVIYSQQETRLTALGGNGEGHRIVFSTSSHQEIFDYLIKAFNTAWKYRFPTFILGDGYQAKMREPVTLYNPEDRGVEMVQPEKFVGREGVPALDREPAHYRNTYNIEEELYEVLMANQKDWDAMAREVAEHEAADCDDAEIVMISHGVVSRAVKQAKDELRKAGYKVGIFRPITIRPFPIDAMKTAVKNAQKLLVVESAYGQLLSMVRDYLYEVPKPIDTILRPGVGITAEEVVRQVKEMK